MKININFKEPRVIVEYGNLKYNNGLEYITIAFSSGGRYDYWCEKIPITKEGFGLNVYRNAYQEIEGRVFVGSIIFENQNNTLIPCYMLRRKESEIWVLIDPAQVKEVLQTVTNFERKVP